MGGGGIAHGPEGALHGSLVPPVRFLRDDSGNGHLAAMYGVPVVTLWGVTHPYAGFVPFNQPESNQLMADRKKYPLIPTSIYGNKYPPNYELVMNTIPPETVVSKVEKVI